MKNLITIYEVAAFTDQATGGSPTGVVLDADKLTSDQMQHIASQVNFSHTAFLKESADAEVEVRFFTHHHELQTCAHATIAAHFLRASMIRRTGDYVISQRTLSGIQEVEIRQRDGETTVYFKQ